MGQWTFLMPLRLMRRTSSQCMRLCDWPLYSDNTLHKAPLPTVTYKMTSPNLQNKSIATRRKHVLTFLCKDIISHTWFWAGCLILNYKHLRNATFKDSQRLSTLQSWLLQVIVILREERTFTSVSRTLEKVFFKDSFLPSNPSLSLQLRKPPHSPNILLHFRGGISQVMR